MACELLSRTSRTSRTVPRLSALSGGFVASHCHVLTREDSSFHVFRISLCLALPPTTLAQKALLATSAHHAHTHTHLCRRQLQPFCGANICWLHIKRLLVKQLLVMRRASYRRLRPQVSQVSKVGSKAASVSPYTPFTPRTNTQHSSKTREGGRERGGQDRLTRERKDRQG